MPGPAPFGPYGPSPALNVNGLAQQPARVSGNWYSGFGGATGNLTTASVTTAYFAPLQLLSACSVQALGIWLVTGQTSGKIQLAIYPDNGTGLPLLTGGPSVSTGDITATSSGLNVSGAVTAATLPPGLYWGTVMSNNTGIVVNGVGSQTANMMAAMSGATSQNGLQSSAVLFVDGYTLTGQTYGTFPTSGSPASGTASPTGPLVQYQSS